jgi:pyruvate,water dikinase
MDTLTRTPSPVPLAAARDAARFGAKAAGQARLAACGLAVPGGVVVGDDVRRAYLARRGLDELDAAGLCAAALPADLLQALLAACAPLARPLIVRSSGLGEDSAAASFAGLLESIGGVTSDAALERALRACWAARGAQRVRAYEARRGVRLAGLAVLVQEEVRAAFAGVLFTRDPTRPDARGALVEYVDGPGTALVTGRVTPGRFGLREDGALHEQQRLARGADPAPLFAAGEALRDAAQRARAELGGEQDLEWVLDGAGRLFVVQARPITALAPARPSVAWTNANVDENFPTPITPLQYAVAVTGYTHYFAGLARALGVPARARAALEPALARLVGAHEGRLYYQLTHVHAVLRAAPGGAFLAGAFNDFTGAQGFPEELPSGGAGRGGRARRAAGALVTGARAGLAWARLEQRVARFERRVAAYAARTAPAALAALDRVELGRALAGFVRIRRHEWTDAGLADAAAMVSHGLLLRLLSSGLADGDPRAAAGELLQGLDVVSAAPAAGLWELARAARADAELEALVRAGDDALALAAVRERPRHARFAAALDEWLALHGHRCSGELVLTVESYADDPPRVFALLRAYLDATGPAPAAARAARALERTAALARVRARLAGWRRPALGPLARACARAVGLRERARARQALLYRRLRAVGLALGGALVREGLLAEQSDAFYLTLEELADLAAGTALQPRGAARVAAVRRAEHARQACARPPGAFTLPEGEAWSGDGPDDAAAPRLAGTGACAGIVTGRAVVLADVSEADVLRPGDVLVTRQTDPGWAPLFPLIAGLVVERGGLLSHGAILAREYGLPTVVGVPGATRAIVTGRTIRVDGGRGHVRIVEG